MPCADFERWARSFLQDCQSRAGGGFTPKNYVQSLIQYNSASHQVGMNIRLAMIRLANTGLFVVYNSRFDTLGLDSHDLTGTLQRPTGARSIGRYS